MTVFQIVLLWGLGFGFAPISVGLLAAVTVALRKLAAKTKQA